MHSELTAIKRAAQAYKINVEVTCLVVQKRHHIRLFPMKDEDSDDRNKNVKAGTIVDTGITHPNHIDFYLVSHASIQVNLVYINVFIYVYLYFDIRKESNKYVHHQVKNKSFNINSFTIKIGYSKTYQIQMHM